MPRKTYTPKNPYCKNSKLSAKQFEYILAAWLEGATPANTSKTLADIGHKVSRQSVQNMYMKIGKWAWETQLLPLYEQRYLDEETLERSKQSALNMKLELTDDELKHRLLLPVLQSIRFNVLGKLDYQKFRERWGDSPDNEETYAILRKQSKKANGLPKKYFEYHLARAILLSKADSKAELIKELLDKFKGMPV